MNYYQRAMIIDMTYNLGTRGFLGVGSSFSGGYPTFIKGILTEDCCLIKTQYHRKFLGVCT